jgi:glycosyltransferase involved in cell wall biosynthesis
MRVLFNGASAIRPKTGVGQTTAQLHRALVTAYPDHCFWLYPGERVRQWATRFYRPAAPATGRGSPAPAPPRPDSDSWPQRLARRLARAGYAAHFHALARLGRFDLYHEPNLVPFRVPLPTVVTVHDLSVILYPHWHPADRVRRYEQAFARGIATAAHILVDSDAVRDEALRLLGLAPERVTTVPCGINPAFRPQPPGSVAAVRRRLGLPPRYLLYVGTVEPRKNVGTLLRAFCDLPAELRDACPLVLGGAWGWKSEPEREFFEAVARHRGVRYLGYVADDDLPGLYTGAEALFYPSHYEGFGLPPIEMMACGGAAVVSTAAAVREVVGPNAPLLEPGDLAGWREAMQRTITDRDYLAPYRQAARATAARFSWANAARLTFATYQAVLGLGGPSASLGSPPRSDSDRAAA